MGSRNYGEAGRTYYIFTRDLGMIHASAQGVRKMSSKLRFVLQDFAYLRVDLVQGKDFWRVTSASKTGELEKITKQKENFKIFSNIARLLRRLLPGTEPNEPLFEAVFSGLARLEAAGSKEDLEGAELDLVFVILGRLGYLEAGEKARTRREAVSLINRILRETHL